MSDLMRRVSMAQAYKAGAGRNWPFEVKPLHAQFGCEIIGLPLADAVAPAMFSKVYEAFLDYQLLLFRDVELPPATQVAFARCFGEVQVHVMNQYHGYDAQPEVYKLTNLDEHG
ncbi:MAG: TauD/TfdA family dioxygenase, partial [Pseudomonadota bacterium]